MGAPASQASEESGARAEAKPPEPSVCEGRSIDRAAGASSEALWSEEEDLRKARALPHFSGDSSATSHSAIPGWSVEEQQKASSSRMRPCEWAGRGLVERESW